MSDNMYSTRKDRSKIVEIDGRQAIYSVFFTTDGKQVLSGGNEGIIRQWQADDGKQVGNKIHAGGPIYAAALSTDRKWLVCGVTTQPYARVWDAETHTKALDIYGHTDLVQSIDIASNSRAFATGGQDRCAFIWSITTGKQLVGPLQHNSNVVAVRFSPNGDRLATASVGQSIRIFSSGDGQNLFDIPCSLEQWISSPLAWSVDGRQLFAASASFNGVKCFDASSGSLLSTWSIPGNSLAFPSVATSFSQKFIAIAGNKSLFFWDASTHQKIGPTIEHDSGIYFMALSPDDKYIVTGEDSGKIILRCICDILPDSYFAVQVNELLTLAVATYLIVVGEILCDCFLYTLPLIQISGTAFETWAQKDLSSTENFLTEEILHDSNPSRYARAIALRSLVRSRMKYNHLATDDAKKSVAIHPSTIGRIAMSVARVQNGEHDAAMRVFDLVFTDGLTTESSLILLIKAIVFFECGKHDDAISRVKDLIDTMDDKTPYINTQAQMYLMLGRMSLKEGDYLKSAEWLRHAQEAVPPIPEECPQLVTLSLIFGWNFDGLAPAIEQVLEQCMKSLEDLGDAAVQSKNPGEAVAQYSAALSLEPARTATLLIKRSKARAILMLWEDALKDADEAVKADPLDPWGYERRHAALHGLQRYDEAAVVLNHMISLTEQSQDSETRCKCHCGVGGNAALNHMLEEMMAHSGEATVLAWTGRSSSYNSCLPASLSIHGQTHHIPLAIGDAEMDRRVEDLKKTISPADAMLVYDRLVRLPPTRFAHRRLYLPSVLFPVKKITEKDAAGDLEEKCYRARVSGIGHVEFRTADCLSLAEPRKLMFSHPWIRNLPGSIDEIDAQIESDSDESWSDSDTMEACSQPQLASGSVAGTPLYAGPVAAMDDYTRALRLVVRLQQPFNALLLQQQPHGEYKRVAAEHEIVLSGLECRVSSAKGIRIEVVEIS